MEDQAIVQMYWDRDEKAISVTEEKYGAYCLTIARNILGNNEDAEECVNTTWWNTWNSIPSNRPSTLSTYLGKIVRNISFNLYKKNNAQKRGSGEIALVLDELAEVIVAANSTEEIWNEKILLESINDFLGKLPETKRKIFVFRYWYAYSVEEIATRLDIPKNTVVVTCKRLRKRLHNHLLERGFEI